VLSRWHGRTPRSAAVDTCRARPPQVCYGFAILLMAYIYIFLIPLVTVPDAFDFTQKAEVEKLFTLVRAVLQARMVISVYQYINIINVFVCLGRCVAGRGRAPHSTTFANLLSTNIR